MSLEEVIKVKQKQQEKKHFTWNGIEVWVKDPITSPKISVKDVLGTIIKKIPNHLMQNIDSIYVGQFEFLQNRSIQAMYENSSIFVTNTQEDKEDMCDDIVHEIAHSVEEMYKDPIYSDGELEREFVSKRKHLYSLLRSEKLEANLSDFINPSYSESFDQYLYQSIGYPMLRMVASSIFYSPYAVTSLREYFANGFEAFYYFDDYDFIKKSCPKLFSKLYSLMEVKQDDYEY